MSDKIQMMLSKQNLKKKKKDKAKAISYVLQFTGSQRVGHD